MKKSFRTVYLADHGKAVAQIEGKYFSVIGNGNIFEIKNLKRDWGKSSKWGKYIKI